MNRKDFNKLRAEYDHDLYYMASNGSHLYYFYDLEVGFWLNINGIIEKSGFTLQNFEGFVESGIFIKVLPDLDFVLRGAL